MKTKFITLFMGMLLLLSCHSSQQKPSKLRIGQFMFTDRPVKIIFTKDGESTLQQQLKYTELTDYQSINSGTYTVEVKAENQLLLKKKVGIGNSGVYTLILYGILQENPTTNAKTSKTKLLAEGFNFQYFTSTYTTQAGKTYYFIYNQGYLPLENEEFYALVKRN